MKDGHRDGCQCHGCVCSRYEIEIHSLTNDIEHERKENAALKEQVTLLQNGNAALDSDFKKVTEAKWEAFEETIAAQAAELAKRQDQIVEDERVIAAQQSHIEQLREALVAVRDDLDLRMRISEDDSLNISNSVLDQMCDAIDIPSSTDALKEHDTHVIANFLEREGKWMTNDAMLKEHNMKQIAEFIHKFKRHVGGDGEFWLHELEDFADKIRKGEF